jgi:hypothetical protein
VLLQVSRFVHVDDFMRMYVRQMDVLPHAVTQDTHLLAAVRVYLAAASGVQQQTQRQQRQQQLQLQQQ